MSHCYVDKKCIFVQVKSGATSFTSSDDQLVRSSSKPGQSNPAEGKQEAGRTAFPGFDVGMDKPESDNKMVFVVVTLASMVRRFWPNLEYN